MKLNLNIFKSEFNRNVITLMTGTAIAQAIPIAISPILTRIYSPEDFGILALYLSITSILSVIATGRYEFAITLPVKDEDAIQILWLSSLLTILVALITLLIVVIFNSEIIDILENRKIGKWLYFIPLTILFSGIYQSFNYWHNRKREYSTLSISKVVQTSNTSIVNLGLGFVNNGGIGGLILGNVFGQFLSTCYLIYFFFKKKLNKIKLNKIEIIKQAKRYKDFPKYDVLASFFNLSSNQITHILFNLVFGAITSGYFYLTQRIFTVPVTLIAGAIQDVFKMEVISISISKGNTRKIYIKTFKSLVILALIPTVLIYFFSIDVFVIVFGEQWRPAGEFVKIMTPVFFFRFISFPLSYMFYVVEKQWYNTISQFISLILVLISFGIGRDYSPEFTVMLLSVSYSLFYLIQLTLSFKCTKTGN